MWNWKGNENHKMCVPEALFSFKNKNDTQLRSLEGIYRIYDPIFKSDSSSNFGVYKHVYRQIDTYISDVDTLSFMKGIREQTYMCTYSPTHISS